MCVLFLMTSGANEFNYNGDLYKPSTSFEVVERPHAYKAYSLNHQHLVDEISKLPDDIPI
jgi:hypothetical protein